MESLLVINEKDNVAVALLDLRSGDTLKLPVGRELTTTKDIPYGHKVALVDIPEGESVIKYGETIGLATRDIVRGEWVHTHNMGAVEGES